jgi:hypothetical protein
MSAAVDKGDRPTTTTTAVAPAILAAACLIFVALAGAQLWRPLMYDDANFFLAARAVADTGLPFGNQGWMGDRDDFSQRDQWALWHPPLYVYLLGAFARVGGATAAVLRLPGVLGGLATGLLTAALSYELTRAPPAGRRLAAALAGALVLVCPLSVQSALILDIDFPLLLPLTLAFLLLYVRLQASPRGWLVLVPLFGLLLWTKMTSPLPLLGVLVIWQLLRGQPARAALHLAGKVVEGHNRDDFATVVAAVHDPSAGTLAYAAAGHPPPIVVSNEPFRPILAGAAPPLGVGASTGQRQTTVPFPRGSIACFYTDGLSEARMPSGRLVGAAGLERIVRSLGPDVTAQQVIDEVASASRRIGDDAAACVIGAEDGSAILRSRVEHLELTRSDLRGPLLRRFLDACGVSPQRVRAAERQARELAGEAGGAVLDVRMGERPDVDVRAPDMPLREDVVLSGADRPSS